ncbi:MAG: hypothetical protein ABL901_20200 [Hyphomicrobiaceae bacterium]
MNNTEREKHAQARKLSATELLQAAGRALEAERPPYVPVKHKATSRKQWLDKKEITDRMKQMRAELDKTAKAAGAKIWEQQSAERELLDARTEAAIDQVKAQAKEHYRKYWRDLYRAQKREKKHVRELMAYEAKQKSSMKPSARLAMDAINRPVDRVRDLDREHEQARRSLARQQRQDTKLHTDAIEAEHRAAFDIMKERQAIEREAGRAATFEETKGVTFMAAKEAILDERQRAAERPFKRAPEPERTAEPKTKADDKESLLTMEQRLDRPSERPTAAQDFGKAAQGGQAAPLSRADQIKRDMADWRERNQGKDFGREL